jgi:hypothetical protein
MLVTLTLTVGLILHIRISFTVIKGELFTERLDFNESTKGG